MALQFELMKPDEMNECIKIAAKAFENYDFFSVYIPSDRKRPLFLRSMIGTEYRVNRGLVHYLVAKENGKIVAVATVRSPEYQMPSEKQYLRAGFWKNLVIGGYKNVVAWYEMDQAAGKPCQELGGNTWYLHLLAVDVKSEGKGIGSRMLKECVIPYVKEHGGETLSLYTNSEINRKFYIKNGFHEFHEQRFSYSGRSFGSWSYRMDLAQKTTETIHV